jgi:hypothetical protein
MTNSPQRCSADSRDALIKRLQARVDAHDKMCFGSTMALGYYSGNDARLMRDAIDALRLPDVAQSVVMPLKLTGEIACILEDCSPPDKQTPEAVAALIEGYQPTWDAILAALAAQPPAAPVEAVCTFPDCKCDRARNDHSHRPERGPCRLCPIERRSLDPCTASAEAIARLPEQEEGEEAAEGTAAHDEIERLSRANWSRHRREA